MSLSQPGGPDLTMLCFGLASRGHQRLDVWTVGYDAAVSRWRGQAMHLTEGRMSILTRLLDEPGIRQGEKMS